MPTNTKLEKVIANLESAAADLMTFSQDTNDQQMKQMYRQLSQTTQGTINQLRGRLNYVKEEEPEYRQ